MAKKRYKRSHNSLAMTQAILLGTAIVFLLTACSLQPRQTQNLEKKTIEHRIKIDPKSLKPGLAVYYMDGFWRHVNQMPKPERFVEKGKKGKSIHRIDHRFGKRNVFDSGRNRGVGVQMMGFIHLPQAGKWLFKTQSNDGIEVFIEEIQVVSDPSWHSDHFSDPMEFQADKPGWYTLLLRYFQRKGTATLEFYWKPPSQEEFIIIPGNAYWHTPSKDAGIK